MCCVYRYILYIVSVVHNELLQPVVLHDALVGGHSSIFNDRFLDFFIEYVILAERKRASLGRALSGVAQ